LVCLRKRLKKVLATTKLLPAQPLELAVSVLKFESFNQATLKVAALLAAVRLGQLSSVFLRCGGVVFLLINAGS
jgi:hypothetical protein